MTDLPMTDQHDPAMVPETAVDRRNFLKTSVAAVGGVAAASFANIAGAKEASKVPEGFPPNINDSSRYLGSTVDDFPYGSPVEFESHIIRRSVEWLTATRDSSVNFTPLHELEGMVTPNGVAFERHHAGAPLIDPKTHFLMINGLVEKPLIFSMDDIKRLPRQSRFYFLECAANGGMEWRNAQMNSCQYSSGMVHNCEYVGVKLSTLLNEAGVKPSAKWVMAEGGDAAGMNRSIPIEKAMDDCMVAFIMNGEPLRREQGYPIRLVVPGWEGNMWVKWLRRLELGDQPYAAREETSKYTDLLANGKARMHTWEMDVKSVITAPSPEKRVMGKGQNVITGLAWSGRGKIVRVDVSTDGGKNWTEARLAGPVLDKCCTRFYLDWNWDGNEALLESRAVDSQGNVQPTMNALRKVRGAWSIYHNNGIRTWHVLKDGTVESVQTDA